MGGTCAAQARSHTHLLSALGCARTAVISCLWSVAVVCWACACDSPPALIHTAI